ncbi:Fe(3+)-hydroxamate ABC transporter permease FhuB [Nitratireductor pacificus]|uniref:Iron-hydroxamate transporter permease subunit n=1 Tax=Nitratireductor pacificus pht-3B TaxID=391937 RepID=K2LRW5_9HYPH|nr:Fe(3+)-hydroxamate ABC transporter permease FhuB [Nitratireductor pacificus]EKF20534.1 iron-hydroxamate transporter permease subunit [Nitratireductor pacificus pht-3B]
MRADAAAPAGGQPARAAVTIALVLLLAAAGLSGVTLSRLAAPAEWLGLLAGQATTDTSILLAAHSLLPRIAVGLLAGAGLALAGVVFQNVLRNPLAEPATLGVSAGAQLALVVATLWFPSIADTLRAEGIAFLGALAAILLVIAIGWSRVLSPTRMIVAGVFVSLYAGAVSGVLVLFNQHYLTGVFLWGSGSLVQNGWDAAWSLSGRLAFAVACIAMLTRPMALLSIGDESARALGVRVPAVRLAALALATALSASIVSAVGMIAFIGLAAPAIARAAGARTLSAQLVTAPLIGAGLLCLTDQFVQLAPFAREIPTGAATALIGGPLLLWLLPRMRATSVPATQPVEGQARLARPAPMLLAGCLVTALVVACALMLGRTPQGWSWLAGQDLAGMLPWRWPRVLASFMAGGMLAAAGVLIQRTTSNPLGSPEILGISSGAALGLIALLFLMPAPSQFWQLAATTAGAALAFAVILGVGARSGYAQDKLLLVGIAFGTMLSALAAVLMASGDPRMATLLSWMAGSTYGMTEGGALVTAAVGCLLLALLPLTARPLGILPLGEQVARALGIGVSRTRTGLLLLTAGLTATATLTVGPLTFVGLLAPHMTRLAGFQKPAAHLAASILAGASIMVAADWLGRSVIFPYQIPAGLFASFLAGPLFLILLRRQS